MSHFSLKSSSGDCQALDSTIQSHARNRWNSLGFDRCQFQNQSCLPDDLSMEALVFPSKCMVLAIHFKITGYTLKRESLVLSVCTGIVFSGAWKRWINLIPCSIAFWWYESVRWRFYFSIMLWHCEYPLSMNKLRSFPWTSGNNVQWTQNTEYFDEL